MREKLEYEIGGEILEAVLVTHHVHIVLSGVLYRVLVLIDIPK